MGAAPGSPLIGRRASRREHVASAPAWGCLRAEGEVRCGAACTAASLGPPREMRSPGGSQTTGPGRARLRRWSERGLEPTGRQAAVAAQEAGQWAALPLQPPGRRCVPPLHPPHAPAHLGAPGPRGPGLRGMSPRSAAPASALKQVEPVSSSLRKQVKSTLCEPWRVPRSSGTRWRRPHDLKFPGPAPEGSGTGIVFRKDG